jgi:hypothetical protein
MDLGAFLGSRSPAWIRVVDYGPDDERWAIAAGVLAAGAVATRFALRKSVGESSAPVGGEAAFESGVGEAALESGAVSQPSMPAV